MKTKSISFLLLPIFLLSFTNAKSQNLNAQTLSFGTGNTFSSGYGAATKGASIGTSNTIRSDYNLAVGSDNYMEGSYSLAIGGGNYVRSDNSLIVGTLNQMNGDFEFGISQDSIVAGLWNASYGQSSFCIGTNNSISSTDTGFALEFPSNTMLLGKGLISRTDDCVVVGKNNLYASVRQTGEYAPVFVVGTGQSASARADALVVRANGDIIITKPQGDISMGDYE